MEFFQTFTTIYNKVQKNQHFNKIIPPNDEEWLEFSKKLETSDVSLKDNIYLYIVHYHYLTTGILDQYPYGIKNKGKDIVINYSNLPYILQHIILSIFT
jgi:hypothetical protein